MRLYVNPESELAREFWEKGRADDCPVYDMHGHMHEMPGGFLPAGEPEQMLVTMRRAGIKHFIFCSHLSLFSAAGGEAYNIDPVKKNPEIMRAYMAVRSYDLNFQRDSKIMEENKDVYAGFKFLSDYFHVPLNAPEQADYWRYADENKLLCLCHTWKGSPYNGPGNVRKIAEKYRDITIICGHSFHDDWKSAAELCNEFPNIYLELTAVLDDRGALEYIVEKAGSEKILFGTDLPWFSTFHGIGCVLDAEMTDGDRRNIFYGNAEKLLIKK